MKKTAVLLLFWIAAALSAQNAIPSQGTLRFQSGPYSLILSAPSAFTPTAFRFEDTELLAKSGANGTILSFPGGKMLGASTATEKVEKLHLTVDGREQEIRTNGQYAGKRIVLEKESVIGGYCFFSSYILTPDGLELPIRYRCENDQKPSYFYLFAMGFSPQFNEYLTPAGQGSFQADGTWGPNSDFPWAALYMKSAGTGVVLSFPEKIPVVSRKNTFWDQKVYKKFYLFHAVPEFKPGKESPVYQMNIRAFKVPENKWSETAKEIAGKMNAFTNNSAPKAPAPERKLNPTPIPDFGDTSKEDWKSNRRGIEALSPDFVLPPFENVQADSNGAKVWNRRYDLDGSGLLSKVLIGNESFFSRPMSMDITVNSQKVAFRPSGSKMLMNKKGRAVFERTLTSTDLDLKTVTTIEFDGMVRVDMTLIPKKKLSLDRFSYAFHLPRKNALFTHFIGAPNSHISIMIPKESFTMPVPEKNGEFFREPFKSLVWFGNHDKGFLWFCGSERNWSPQDQSLRPSALTASATDKEVSFQTVPVSAPYVIQSPVTYTFGFFATPVRPMPDGWRDWFCSTRRGIYDSETRHGKVGTLPMIWPDEYRTNGVSMRIKDTPKVEKWIKELHAADRPALTYCDPIRASIGLLKYLDMSPRGQQLNDLYLAKDNAANDFFLYRTPELAENMKNWQTLPELIYNYGAAHGGLEVRVSSASGWADFFCFLVEKMALMGFDGFGDIDNCFPIRDMNEAHGAGYVDQDGIRRYEWDWFARRDLMKRIAAIFLKTRGKPGILVAHSSATWSIPFISFCDANMTFEHSNSGYFSNPGFLSKYGKHNPEITGDMKAGGKQFLRYAFPKERWQAELNGAQFGLPCIVMSNLTKSPQVDKEYAKSKRAARELGAFVAAHDCLLWPIWCNTAPLIRLIEIRKEFGLGNKDVECYPYWSDANPVKSSNPAISVTTYRRPGKLLLNVCNLTDNEAEASLEFGSLVPVQIINQETGRNRVLEHGKLKVKVDGRDYRIYTIVLK